MCEHCQVYTIVQCRTTLQLGLAKNFKKCLSSPAHELVFEWKAKLITTIRHPQVTDLIACKTHKFCVWIVNVMKYYKLVYAMQQKLAAQIQGKVETRIENDHL